MKHIIRNTMLSVLLVLAATVYGGVPSLKVTVFDNNGAIAFNGATNANATFATGNLRPGHYVVQFDSTSAALRDNQYLIVISAGTKKVIADAVPGEKIAAGVMMKVKEGHGMNITGQVAREQAVLVKGSPNVRVINGRRYYWVAAETGSNLGGHWVEEGLGGARNLVRIDSAYLRHIQDHAGEGSLLDTKGRADGYAVDH
jgi:hypothetical protein